MAETLGIVTSILQLADTTLRARDYIQDFRNAPQEQKKLLIEVGNLKPLLLELRKRITAESALSFSALQHLKEPLVQLEGTMVRLVHKLDVAELSKLSQLSNRIKWPLWGKRDVQEGLQEIERIVGFVSNFLTLDIWDATREQRQDHLAIIKSVEDNTQELRVDLDVAERERIIKWLTSLNFFQRQAAISDARQPCTGRWLLEDRRFKEWESGSGKILWCRGMPGAGKTVLASLVVDHLGAQFEDEEIKVACMYLNHKETETQTPSHLLASLWRQLIVGKSITSLTHKLYKHHRERETRPSLNEMREILSSSITEYSKVYIVVDALDEYPETQRNVLLESLSMMGPTVNLMLTSRPHIDLGGSFSNFEALQIRAREDDVRLYIDTQILKSSRLSKHVNTRPELRDEIHSKIIGSVDGMFLLAKLHIDSLTTKSTVKAVRDALKNLPKTLEDTYNEAMERINRQNEEDRNIARSALTWISNAKRLLTVSELREALAIEPGTEALDHDNLLDISIILSVCAGLVTVEETETIVRLIHYTAQDYLESVEFPDAQVEITLKCITYLCFSTFDLETFGNHSDSRDEFPTQYAFVEYAQYCLMHAAGKPEVQLARFITTSLERHAIWRRVWRVFGVKLIPPWDYRDWPHDASPLWLAAAFNLQEIARHLLLSSSKDARDDTLLHVAAYYGHFEMVQLLLENGVDVNIRGGIYGTALYAASIKGYAAVVKVLIDNGADVQMVAGTNGYHTALYGAVDKNYPAVVHILLDRGADLARGDGTILRTAAYSGHEAIVRLLLDAGADVRARGGQYDTALQAASVHGHESIVRLLIARGADPNARGGAYNSALQAASYSGNVAVVQLLLASGAEVHAEGGVLGSALRAALVKGHTMVAKLLVENGARSHSPPPHSHARIRSGPGWT
ncbi:hypothetical protein C8R44DRAFT_774980 [Mycena epipterygia]|nr:hypothetical protein C8R44DRAFT_774980 [Mycena epipterygia]